MNLGRRLLGGQGQEVDFNDPGKMCKDPCFSPYMNSMLAFMNTMISDKECTAAFSTDKRRSMAPSRMLLGGSMPASSTMKYMELAMGMLCSKNAKGNYCMKLFNDMDKTG